MGEGGGWGWEGREEVGAGSGGGGRRLGLHLTREWNLKPFDPDVSTVHTILMNIRKVGSPR